MPISLAASAGHTHVLSYLLRQDRNTNLLLDDTKVHAFIREIIRAGGKR